VFKLIKIFLRNSRYFYWFVAIYFFSLLSISLIAQYLFNIVPCSLCYHQRYIMMAVAILALGIVISGYDRKFFTCILCFIAFGGVTLSIFHIGVEQKWWAMPKSCLTNIELPSTNPIEMLKSLNEQMKNQKIPRCDKISWYLFGLPASWWTSLAFSLATITMVWREWKIREK
jgi:disulfide bond formation protein DsbB